MFRERITETHSDFRERTLSIDSEQMKELDAGWYGFFRKTVLGNIRQDLFEPMFSSRGRPGIPVDILLGIMFLALYLNVPEEYILGELVCSIGLQYALSIDPRRDPIPTKRTLIRFRARCILYRVITGRDILHEQSVIIAQAMAKEQGMEPILFRMDTVMLNVYAQAMSRSQMLYHAIQGVVLAITGTGKKALYRDERRHNVTLEEIFNPGCSVADASDSNHHLAHKKATESQLPEKLWHYLYIDDYHSRFYAQNNRRARTEDLLDDALLLYGTYKETFQDLPEFKLFLRFINEQCEWASAYEIFQGDANVTYAGKAVLKFKQSKAERKQEAAAGKELKRLRDAAGRSWKAFSSAKKKHDEKAAKADEYARKSEKAAPGPKKQSFQEKAEKAAAEAASLAADAEQKRLDYEEDSLAYDTALSSQAEKEAYAVADDSVRRSMEAMSSSILQTLNDWYATYCEKNDKRYRGYKLGVIEMAESRGHSMPVEWETVQNNVSDARTGATLIGRLKAFKKTVHKVIVADGAFSGKEIDMQLEEVNGEIVNTEMTGQKTKDCHADHQFNEEGSELIRCAGGQTPAGPCKQTRGGVLSVPMNASVCRECKHFGECDPTVSKKRATLKTSIKKKARAAFLRTKGTLAHVVAGRFRNGIEATMNGAKKTTPVVREPIYGYYRVSLFNDLAMVAYCFRKYMAQRKMPCPNENAGMDYLDLFPADEAGFERECRSVSKDIHTAIGENSQPDVPPVSGGGSASDDSDKPEEQTSQPDAKKEKEEIKLLPILGEVNIQNGKTGVKGQDILPEQEQDGQGRKEQARYIFIVDPEGICTVIPSQEQTSDGSISDDKVLNDNKETDGNMIDPKTSCRHTEPRTRCRMLIYPDPEHDVVIIGNTVFVPIPTNSSRRRKTKTNAGDHPSDRSERKDAALHDAAPEQ